MKRERADERVGRGRLWAYVELARLSNVPTVLSNVLVGFGIGAASGGESAAWWSAVVLAAAMMLFYVGGMALNDFVDAAVDGYERPERPIPSGRVSRGAAGVFAGVCLVAGLVMVLLFGWEAGLLAVGLVGLIVVYDVVHKMTGVSGVIMGLCRGMVYVTVASAIAWPLDWGTAGPIAIAMTAYIAVMTFIARSEAAEDASGMTVMLRRRLAILLPGIAFVPALAVVPGGWGAAIVAGLVMLGWLVAAQRHLLVGQARVKEAVLSYIAGICLIDAFYLTLLERNELAVVAGICFVVTLLGHRRVSGT